MKSPRQRSEFQRTDLSNLIITSAGLHLGITSGKKTGAVHGFRLECSDRQRRGASILCALQLKRAAADRWADGKIVMNEDAMKRDRVFGALHRALEDWVRHGNEQPLTRWLGRELDSQGVPIRLPIVDWPDMRREHPEATTQRPRLAIGLGRADHSAGSGHLAGSLAKTAYLLLDFECDEVEKARGVALSRIREWAARVRASTG